jgi:hypothetical protein
LYESTLMDITLPVHPNPADFDSVDAYILNMDTWWRHAMQEELAILADRIPLMQITWRNRWYTAHFPGSKPRANA